jgi:hypothetical protein
MPYNINNFNGTVFTTVADGVIDRQFSSSIYLIGKNVTGYGAFQNDNFLWLLQNFAGQAEPINKIQGQTWFDTTAGVLKLKVFDGSDWKNLAEEGDIVTNLITTGATTATGTIIGNWSLDPGSKLTSTYADLAENYTADDTYSPGAVMEFGGTAETTLCQTDMSTKIAGIISTAPAFLLNDQYEIEGYVYSIALAGRVPCYVKGTINKGDMLVSGAGGYARAESNPKPGSIIARAIDSYDSDEIGTIEVQVSRG